MPLSQEEVQQLAKELAPELVRVVQAGHHDFWIDPESHYADHKDWTTFKEDIGGEGVYDLKNIIGMYRTTKSLWFKAFLGAAAVGSIIVTMASMGFHR